MELYRKELKLAVIKGLDESRGSSNVPIKLTHDTSDEYINYTEQIHIRYLFDNQLKEEILPTNDNGFYIPGKPLSHDGPIELAVHLINGDIELVTNELSFVVKNAPNGTTQVDPSEFTWQQLVDQYVNAKLDTFANKLDLSKFEETVNGSIENQNQNIESFKTEVNANLSNQDKKITDLQNTTKVSLDSQNTKIDNFKSEVNTSLSNQNTSINQTTSAQNSKITTLESRMDTFTRLSEGSTTGDAELHDIRVGANGTTYDTAGNAVRGQYSQLKEELTNFENSSLFETESINIAKTVETLEQSTQYATMVYVSDTTLRKGKTYILSFDTPNTGARCYVNDACGFDMSYFYCDGARKSYKKTFTDEVLLNRQKVISFDNGNSTKITNVMISESLDTTYLPYDEIKYSNGYVTPQNFGAVGDGITNDTNAIQKAIRFSEIYTGWLHFPCGEYLVDGDLISNKGIKITGASSGTKYTQNMGNKVSVLKLKSGSDKNLLTLRGTAYFIRDIEFCGTYPTDEYEEVENTEVATDLVVFSESGASWGNQECNSYISFCRFRKSTGNGLKINRVACNIDQCMFDQCRNSGIYVNSSECTIKQCEFYWCGFDNGANGSGIYISNWVCRVHDCNMYKNNQSIVISSSARDVVIRDTALGTDKKHTILCYGQQVLLDNVRFCGNGETWFSSMAILDLQNNTKAKEPIILRDCLFDNSDGEYNLLISETNERPIIVDNPRFKNLTKPSNFINTTSGVKVVSYVDYIN